MTSLKFIMVYPATMESLSLNFQVPRSNGLAVVAIWSHEFSSHLIWPLPPGWLDIYIFYNHPDWLTWLSDFYIIYTPFPPLTDLTLWVRRTLISVRQKYAPTAQRRQLASAFVAGSVKFISCHLFDPVSPETYDNYYRDWLSCHLRENEACSGPELTTQQLCCSCASCLVYPVLQMLAQMKTVNTWEYCDTSLAGEQQ